MSFENLNVKHEIVKALKEMDINEPTKIQVEAIPPVMEGKDVIGMSKTGSGKTAAFGIPLIEKIVPKGGLQVLIMAPIRELAVQIAGELEKFGKYLDFNVATVFGGVGLGPQITNMERSEIVVGTPGRLLDHLQRRNINLTKINCVVLDEADKMVDMGFIEDVEKIIQAMPNRKQMLLFGATISDEVNMIKKKYMRSPTVAKAEAFVKQDVLSQFYYNVEPHEKFSILVHLLKNEPTGRCIVFCAKRTTVDLVTKNLQRNGIKCENIHGKLSQNRRLDVINNFKHGKPSVLVASAVAARGLDIKEVTHVFNYDLSQDPQEYIHRVGRTARAGDSGKAITLLSPQDHDAFNNILRYYDVKVEAMPTMNFPRLRFDARRSDDRGGRGRDGFRGVGRVPRRYQKHSGSDRNFRSDRGSDRNFRSDRRSHRDGHFRQENDFRAERQEVASDDEMKNFGKKSWNMSA